MSKRADAGRAILKATATPQQELTQQEQRALAEATLGLLAVVQEVHSWIVCAAIATPEDLMQSAHRIAEITAPDYEGD